MKHIDGDFLPHRQPYWARMGTEPAKPGVEPMPRGIVSAPQTQPDEARLSTALPAGVVSQVCYAFCILDPIGTDAELGGGDVIVVQTRKYPGGAQSATALINGAQMELADFRVDSRGIDLRPVDPGSSAIRLRHAQLQVLGIVAGAVGRSETSDSFGVQ